MINPNKQANEGTLRRLKEGSYERMRVELKCSVESKMEDFDMSWDDLGILLGFEMEPFGEGDSPGQIARWKVVQGQITLIELNALAHIFSTEPYIIFRPRDPWTAT